MDFGIVAQLVQRAKRTFFCIFFGGQGVHLSSVVVRSTSSSVPVITHARAYFLYYKKASMPFSLFQGLPRHRVKTYFAFSGLPVKARFFSPMDSTTHSTTKTFGSHPPTLKKIIYCRFRSLNKLCHNSKIHTIEF